jgi:hypothetical protein
MGRFGETKAEIGIVGIGKFVPTHVAFLFLFFLFTACLPPFYYW